MAGANFDTCAFLRLIYLLNDKDCEEHHDRIFAVRSIAGLDKMESLNPDYTLPLTELYRRVVVECLNHLSVNDSVPGWLIRYGDRHGSGESPLPHASLLLALSCSKQSIGQPSGVPTFDSLSNGALAKFHEYGWHLGAEYLLCAHEPDGAVWDVKSKRPLETRTAFTLSPGSSTIFQVLGSR